MLTRRGFIGSMLAVPAASVLIGSQLDWPGPAPAPAPAVAEQTPIELLFDAGATRSVSVRRFARAVFIKVDQRLRTITTRVVGAPDARLGDVWGSGVFRNHLFALVEDLPTGRNDGLLYDRVLIESIGTQLADRICAKDLRYFGRLALPVGGMAAAGRIENSRLSLRFVTMYDIYNNRMSGRFDVLG